MEVNKKEGKPLPRPARDPKRVKNQNGKGDSPRNVSPHFRDNYEKIKWKKP